jgi:hypothetical protein
MGGTVSGIEIQESQITTERTEKEIFFLYDRVPLS